MIEEFDMGLFYLALGVTLFVLIYYGIRYYNQFLNDYIRSDVEKYFVSQGYEIVSMKSAHKDPNSPFNSTFDFSLSTLGIEETGPEFFNQRYFRIEVIEKKGRPKVFWIDCFYFFKIRFWFIVKEEEVKA